MVDQRHTLPNLKYLLTVLTAGKGEVPARKKGGASILENGSTGGQRRAGEKGQEAEKGPLMNGKQPYRGMERVVVDETQNT